MMRRLIAFVALVALGPLNAEAQTTRAYPSLAKRPAETRDRTVPATPAVEPAAVDATLVAQVATLANQSASGDSAFQKQIATGRSTVASAGSAAPLSEPWVAAQMAISAVDSARYDSVAALAGLDTLYVERQEGADAARVQADLATISPARTKALALVDAQNDALDSLRRALRQP